MSAADESVRPLGLTKDNNGGIAYSLSSSSIICRIQLTQLVWHSERRKYVNMIEVSIINQNCTGTRTLVGYGSFGLTIDFMVTLKYNVALGGISGALPRFPYPK